MTIEFFLLVFSILVLLFFIFWQLSGFISLIFGTPFVATPKEQIKKAFRLANLKSNETVYDLGCGDGKALIVASKDFKAKALGFEISPFCYLLCCWNLKKTGINPKASVVFKDFRKADLKKADVIYLYLMPKVLEKIRSKLEKETKPNTRIISYKFPIKGLKLYKEDGEIYVYKT